MKRTNKKSGFTLVELAIVLVIIGLIIGGVLTGADLIKAATVRSVVTDVEKINSAATTFRNKYNGLPGDLLNTKATDFTLNAATNDGNRNGAAGKGDGNGIIEACAASANGLGCETALFWKDLSFASLIAGQYNTYTSAAGAPAVGTLATYVPKTKLRDTALITVYNAAGRNYLAIGSGSNAAAAVGAAGAITYNTDSASAAVTPLEARNIDDKVDDGAALTGTMTANAAVASPTDPTSLAAAVASGNNKCVLTGGSYMVDTDAHANNVACTVGIRASF